MTAKEYSFICPECGEIVFLPNLKSLLLVKSAGACADCRLKETLEKVGFATLGAIMDFLERKGAPLSNRFNIGDQVYKYA